jgi:hypothetical protein
VLWADDLEAVPLDQRLLLPAAESVSKLLGVAGVVTTSIVERSVLDDTLELSERDDTPASIFLAVPEVWMVESSSEKTS